MNELLQQHGCANVFNVPEGLRELMADISREVLRWQPPKIYDFIANYLSALLITREHGIMATKILEDVCDCRLTVSEHLLDVGFEQKEAKTLSQIIQEEIESSYEPDEGKAKLREYMILEKILERVPLDEELSTKVCQVARNAYRDFWYRKNVLKSGAASRFDKPWEQAVKHTLELYKKTKPSISEMNRAAERIQAAYKGYHLRRHVLRNALKKKTGRKIDLPGPPLDIDSSRRIDLGTILKINPNHDDLVGLFKEEDTDKLDQQHDPIKAMTLQYNVQANKDSWTSPVLSKPVFKSSLSSRGKRGSSISRELAKDEKEVDGACCDVKVTVATGPTRISFHQPPFEILDQQVSERKMVEVVDELEAPTSEQGGDEVPEVIFCSTAEDPDDEAEGTVEMEDEAAVVSSRSATTDEMSDVPDEA